MKLLQILITFLLFLGLVQCSKIRPVDQFTNKVVAPNFVSELYGSNSQTISISNPNGGHIAWMSFIESNDYKYFKITKVTLGSKTIIQEGMEKDGVVFTASSNAIIEDINVDPTQSSSTGYANGSINVAGSSDLKITIQYSPLVAIESDEVPHEAYLIVNYDAPESGNMRIKLNGFTKGVKAEKCTQAVSTMEPIAYTVVGSAFDLFFCSKEVASVGQNNTTQDTSSSDYRGGSTNVASIPFPDNVVTFYKVDDETVCLLSTPEPSVSPFTLPIPDGLAPITSMDISMAEGSYAECSLDANGNILCDGVLFEEDMLRLNYE